MPEFLQTVSLLVSGAFFGVVLGAVLRRMLNAPVGWPRSIVVGATLLVAIVPLATGAGIGLGVFDAGGTVLVGNGVLAVYMVLMVLWAVVIAAAVLVAFELVWPTPRWRGVVGTFQSYRSAGARVVRYVQIVRILSVTGLRRALRQGLHPSDSGFADALVEMLDRAGGTFVKFGQFLATQVEVVPPETARVLSELQSAATPFPFEEVEATLRRELGGDPGELFAEIDPVPVAAASVAQVHRGALRNGTVVAIKVQRPGIRQQILVDGDIMIRLAAMMERSQPWARELSLRRLTEGLVGSLAAELDYRIEARNMTIARASLGSRSPLVVPRVHSEYSTRRVLVMDFLAGIELTKADEVARELADAPETAAELATALGRDVFASVVRRGIFHADLHPGNIMLLADHRLGIIDFGSVGVLDDETRRLLATLLLGILHEDSRTAADAIALAFDSPDGLDVEALRRDLGQELTIMRHLARFDTDQVARILAVLRRHHIGVPGNIAAAFRTIASLSTALTALWPQADIVSIAMAEVPRTVAALNAPRVHASRALGAASIGSVVLARLPQRVERIGTDLLAGNLSVRVRPLADTRDRRWLRSVVDHVLSAALACAAVLAAVFLVTADGGPQLTEQLSFYAVLGYSLALVGFVLALRVVVQLFARRRGGEALR